MSFPSEIILKRGLGHILFGADPDHVRRELGEPSSVVYSPEVNKFTGAWDYAEPSCTLYFNDGPFWNPSLVGSEKPSLVMITGASPGFTLFGDKIINEPEQTILSRLAVHGLVNPAECPIEKYECETPANKHLYYEDALFSLYLLDGVVTHVCWQMPHEGPAPSMVP